MHKASKKTKQWCRLRNSTLTSTRWVSFQQCIGLSTIKIKIKFLSHLCRSTLPKLYHRCTILVWRTKENKQSRNLIFIFRASTSCKKILQVLTLTPSTSSLWTQKEQKELHTQLRLVRKAKTNMTEKYKITKKTILKLGSTRPARFIRKYIVRMVHLELMRDL